MKDNPVAQLNGSVITLEVISTPNKIKNDAWLIVDNVPVSYIRFERVRQPGQTTAIAHIVETRPGHKGKGYASEIIRRVEQECNVTLYTSGDYTAEGFASIGSKLPVLGGSPAGAVYHPWTAVRNWDGKEVPSYYFTDEEAPQRIN